jgi:hypothetical protein
MVAAARRAANTKRAGCNLRLHSALVGRSPSRLRLRQRREAGDAAAATGEEDRHLVAGPGEVERDDDRATREKELRRVRHYKHNIEVRPLADYLSLS